MKKRQADEPEDSIAKLLDVPPFKRSDFKAFLLTPYSAKAFRRMYLYTPHRYWLWIRTETDPNVYRFNERPPKISIPIDKGRAISAAPRFITVSRDETLTVHTFAGEEDAESEPEALEKPISTTAWDDWCGCRGFQHKVWAYEQLYADRLRLENLAELLRFTARPGRPYNGEFRTRILAELRVERRMTFYALARQFPSQDPEEVHAEIAGLIVDRTIFSDIDREPFTMLTELSAHRDPDEK